ncbi:MAG TPA: hypothetical protein VF771_04855, partial [Longimicrobiaceae bacterium]
MQTNETAPSQVRCAEEVVNGRPILVLENGESRLALDPAQGGRWTTWDLALAGGPVHHLMSAPGAVISSGPAVLAATG